MTKGLLLSTRGSNSFSKFLIRAEKGELGDLNTTITCMLISSC